MEISFQLRASVFLNAGKEKHDPLGSRLDVPQGSLDALQQAIFLALAGNQTPDRQHRCCTECDVWLLMLLLLLLSCIKM
jgi:hypothetical protein